MRTQQGMTLLGLLITAIAIIIAGIVLLRVIPIYIENYEVKSSIKALNQVDPSNFTSDAMANVEVLKSKLMNQFTINNLHDIKPEKMSIVPKSDGVYQVTLDYTVIKPLFANASLLFQFSESQEVRIGSH